MSVQDTSSTSEAKTPPPSTEDPWYIRSFTRTLIGLGIGGGAAAIFVPLILWALFNMNPSNVDHFRLHLLYVSGGIIAILTLLQTSWKNQVDRRKIDADITKNKQDAAKNERDHIRQVHAERRSRYAKAVEQLADKEATIRLGGIYTLTGLVDEWLADETASTEERYKEGQVIINNLCAYIRSPFLLADKKNLFRSEYAEGPEPDEYEGDFKSDYAKLREEQDVRQSILEEISSRLGGYSYANGEKTPYAGSWSDFGYDFSRATFFYPVYLNHSVINSIIAFNNANFEDFVTFDSTVFAGPTSFRKSVFNDMTDFEGAIFTKTTKFNQSIFKNITNFNKSKFFDSTEFGGAVFLKIADFNTVEFKKSIEFTGSIFCDQTNFNSTIIRGFADFESTAFGKPAEFRAMYFENNANFSSVSFRDSVDFSGTIFAGSSKFAGIICEESVNFNSTIFVNEAPQFTVDSDDTNKAVAHFSHANNPESYSFNVLPNSNILIETEKVTAPDGRVFILPKGCLLFDPETQLVSAFAEDKAE